MGETLESATTPESLRDALARLRASQAAVLAPMPQAEVVAALAALAGLWRDPAYPVRREAEALTEPFPFAMVQVSLDALLRSLLPEELWALIDAENARDISGHVLIGAVAAGNTPLLAWVTAIRALLVRSAALIKLPSGPAGAWGHFFLRSLRDVSPSLAECISLAEWPGGTRDLDAALCTGSDLVIAHGSDATLAALRGLCRPETPFVGYGHRVSLGLVTRGAGTPGAAAGFARDVLLYDQGGCLSPQTIFVEGNRREADQFAARLAEALAAAAAVYLLPVRSPAAAPAVRQARTLARMEEETQLWEDPAGRWTVVARSQASFTLSPTYGVVSVQPLPSLRDLPEALSPVAAFLQGCAVAGDADWYLPGVSYLCAPGAMQAPPLRWRQDGRDVLRVLLPRR